MIKFYMKQHAILLKLLLLIGALCFPHLEEDETLLGQ